MDGCAGVRLGSGHVYSQQINEWSGIEESVGMEKPSNLSCTVFTSKLRILTLFYKIIIHNRFLSC